MLDPGSAVPRQHLRFVDGLRGLAALYLVLHHAWLQTWPKIVYGDAPTGWTEALTGWLLYGHYAVALFVTISGYCLMLPVLRNGGRLKDSSVRDFYSLRAKRILPAYMAALVISIFLDSIFISNGTHTLYDASLPITTMGVATHFMLIQNLFGREAAQINGPLWFIGIQCQLYLLFPILLAARRRFGILKILAVSLLFSMVVLAMTERTPHAGLNPQYLFVFCLGMYGAEATLNSPW